MMVVLPNGLAVDRTLIEDDVVVVVWTALYFLRQGLGRFAKGRVGARRA